MAKANIAGMGGDARDTAVHRMVVHGPEPSTAVPDMLPTGALAAKFGRSPRTIRRWVERGYLVPIRIGAAVFFRAEDVLRLLNDQLVMSILERKPTRSTPLKLVGGTRANEL